MPRHEERLVAELRRLAASFLTRESDGRSLITVTHVELLPSGRRAVILISVLPEQEELRAIAFARRRRNDLTHYIREHVRTGHLPELDFALDLGEKHRQKIDALVRSDEQKKLDKPR